MKRNLFVVTFLLGAFAQAQGAVADPIILTTNITTGPTVDYWGWDVKGSAGLASTPDKAKALYGDTGANIIRIPIFATAHKEDGSVDGSQYTAIIADVKNALRAEPKLKVFASLKLAGANTFPAWLNSDVDGKIFANNVKRVDPDKYSDLLLAYVSYMQQQGVHIDFLGINNETEGALLAGRYAGTVKALKAKLAKSSLPEKDRVFLFVGAETFEINTAVTYVKTLADTADLDTLDIVGSHYYHTGQPNFTRTGWKNLANEVKIPLWFTEAHIALANKEEIVTAIREGLALVFSANLGGASGFVWWDAGDVDANMDFAIKHEVIRSMMGGHPIQTVPYYNEQSSDPTAPLFQAYRAGDTVHLWIINPGPALDRQTVNLADAELLSVSAAVYWNGPGDELTPQKTGKLTITHPNDRKSFKVDKIPANSVAEITFALAPPQP